MKIKMSGLKIKTTEWHRIGIGNRNLIKWIRGIVFMTISQQHLILNIQLHTLIQYFDHESMNLCLECETKCVVLFPSHFIAFSIEVYFY